VLSCRAHRAGYLVLSLLQLDQLKSLKRNMGMAEDLVDVLNSDGAVVHTFPITLDSSDIAPDADYEFKAFEAAAHAQLVPDAELRA
jgi:hypothetical protein